MSLSHRTEVYKRQKEDADRNHSGYGFVLVLVCVGLVVLLAIAIFDPVSIGGGIDNETWLVGP